VIKLSGTPKQDYNDDLVEKWAAEETAMAKEFDVKLEQEVS
jgi:hypothetical protein